MPFASCISVRTLLRRTLELCDDMARVSIYTTRRCGREEPVAVNVWVSHDELHVRNVPLHAKAIHASSGNAPSTAAVAGRKHESLPQWYEANKCFAQLPHLVLNNRHEIDCCLQDNSRNSHCSPTLPAVIVSRHLVPRFSASSTGVSSGAYRRAAASTAISATKPHGASMPIIACSQPHRWFSKRWRSQTRSARAT